MGGRPPEALYLADVTLFDGTRVRRHAGVLVAHDRIAWVGAHARPPRAAREAREVRGGFVVPGLIDCHVHLAYDGTADMAAEARGLTDAAARRKAARNLQRHLAAGVTTVRDLGARSAVICAVARAIDAGRVEGPRVVAAGRGLTIPGGHGRGMFALEVRGVRELREAVRRQVAGGATVIKLIATGGVVTPGIGVDLAAFTQAELDAAVREAHALGATVAAHAHGAEGIARAVRAGVDSIEHGSRISVEVALEMKRRGIAHCATISPGRVILEHADEVPAYAAEKSREIAPVREASFRRTVRLGVTHVAGTDAGTPFNRHGRLPAELAAMVGWGMRPIQALRAATSNAAALLRLPDLGRVVLGARADLVAYGEDPLDDIGATERPRLVIANGRSVPG
jgi:imidazolonepropionase-like amidohydrolase